TEDAILHRIKPKVEERTRIRPRTQVQSDTQSAGGVNIPAQGYICRPAQRLIVAFRKPDALTARGAKRRGEKSRSPVSAFDRNGCVRQVKDRMIADTEGRAFQLHSLPDLDLG